MKQTRRFRNLWAVGLLLTLTLGCKKEADNATPTPTIETACQIRRIDFGTNGEYELYENDANGRLTKFSLYYADDKGKIPTSVSPGTISYNAQGLAERFNWTDGQGYDLLSYTNGALSKIEVFETGKKRYQFDVTTNASKQITAMKATSFDKDPNGPYAFEYTTTFTIDAQGRYTGLTSKGPDGDYYRETRTGFEPTMKSYFDTWKENGLPIDPTLPSTSYGQAIPTSTGLRLRDEYFYGYDADGKYVGLRKDGEYTFARKANSRNYVVERTDTDVLSKTTSITKYQYNNCN